MQEINWQEIAQKLDTYLRLPVSPVAVKWVKTEEELNAIPKLRLHKEHFPPCVIMAHASVNGWTSACLSENFHSNYCRGINGFYKRDERWYSGVPFADVWFDNAKASQDHNKALECVEPEYHAIVASPLKAGKFEPDVCLLTMTPAQAFIFLVAYQAKTYKKLDFTFVGESTCSDSWVKTFTTKKPGLALPCYADMKFAGMSGDHLRITMVPEDLLLTVEGLEILHRQGIRYPMGSYGLSTDVCAGLPPIYLEY